MTRHTTQNLERSAHPHPSGSHVEELDAPDRRRLPLLLRRAWFSLNQTFRRRLAHLQITPDQFTVMRTLIEAESGGLTQRELTQRMSSDPNTVASLLSRMQRAGLIRREPHEKDRRAHRIQLLATGRKKYEAARAVALTLQTEVLEVLPKAEREPFLACLDQVADACHVAAARSPRAGKR